MSKGLVARVSTSIAASRTHVWRALVTPDVIKRYMFGTTVVSDWKVGSPIFWKGEWEGKRYEDKGLIQRLEPERLLEYTHFSPLSQLADLPENYHTITIELSDRAGQTLVVLSQDNNMTEVARQHSESNWQAMLNALKKLLETPQASPAA